MFASSFRAVFMAIVAVIQAPATPLPSSFSETGTLGIIRPPHGWLEQAIPDFPKVHVTNSFYDANAPSQRILLGRIDDVGTGSLTSIANSITAALSSQPDVKVISSQSDRLCNGAATGWMIRYAESGSYIVETIIVGKLRGNAAIYLRKRDESEDPNALSAMSSLCLVPFPR